MGSWIYSTWKKVTQEKSLPCIVHLEGPRTLLSEDTRVPWDMSEEREGRQTIAP